MRWGLTGSWVRALVNEIDRKRKENQARPEARNWNIDASLKIELIVLLDWVQDELDRILATVT